MPPKNEKPILPQLRGERWKLADGRTVTVLRNLGRNSVGRVFQVINEKGLTEGVFESQFQSKLYPPEGEKEMRSGDNR